MRSLYKYRAARQKPRGSVLIRSCELAVVQRGIGAALREQFPVRSLLGDVAVLHIEDAVSESVR